MENRFAALVMVQVVRDITFAFGSLNLCIAKFQLINWMTQVPGELCSAMAVTIPSFSWACYNSSTT